MMSMYRDSETGKTVVDIKDCDTMREVKVLKMGNLGLTEFDTQLFSQLANLEEMDISRNQVENIPAVVHLPRLRRLDCSHNRLNGLNFVRQFPLLEEISVEGNRLTFADFCIASFLCPKLKSINGQEVDVGDVNRMIEKRMMPKIHKIWSDHMMSLYHHSMTDVQFEALAHKFRLLVNACAKSCQTNTISKFLDFRVDLLANELLARVRNEEVVEFCASEKSVKRNYNKRRKKNGIDVGVGQTADQSMEVPVDLIVSSQSDIQPATVILGAKAEQQQQQQLEQLRVEDEMPMVVAVADEQGNGIVTAQRAAALIASEQLKECSSVTIFVENVVPEPMLLRKTSTDVDVQKVACKPSLGSKELDFVEEECERLMAAQQVVADHRTSTDDHVATMIRPKVKNQRTTAPIKPKLDALDKSNGVVDKQQKVVRYWVYDDEPSKTKAPMTPVQGADGSNTATSYATCYTGPQVKKRVSSGPPARVTQAYNDTKALMKSHGTLPDLPKVTMPHIMPHQAAQRLVEIKSSAMVVYRGNARSGEKDLRALAGAKKTVMTKRRASVKKIVANPTSAVSSSVTTDDEPQQHYFIILPVDSPKPSAASPTPSATQPPSTTPLVEVISVPLQLTNGEEKRNPISHSAAAMTTTMTTTTTTTSTGVLKERTKSKLNDSCFPPKKRVRFIDAFKDQAT